jgi:hypothetical protein
MVNRRRGARDVRAVLIACGFAACWRDATPTTPPPSERHPVSPLTAQLEAHPLELTMATRKDFQIKFVVTNTSQRVVDTHMTASNLFVNGELSQQWAAAVGNGAIDEEWEALPPRHSISREWSIGEELFFKPGDYLLVLHVDTIDSAPLHVHVGE